MNIESVHSHVSHNLVKSLHLLILYVSLHYRGGLNITVHTRLLHLMWKPLGDAKEYDVIFYKYENENCSKVDGEFYKTVDETILRINFDDNSIKGLKKFCIEVSTSFYILVLEQVV